MTHGSIPTINICPRAHLQGFAIFLHLASYSPPPRATKKELIPTQLNWTASCTVSQEDKNIYYVYNIEGKITECWLENKEVIYS